MPFEHRIPDDITPTGDLTVPLIIPHDPQYIGLLLGALITLEEIEYYNRDPDYDNENAQIVAAQWRDRTITPLIEAIASAETCGGGSLPVKITPKSIVLGANRTTTSTTFVDVTGSDFAHTFTYENATIEAIALLANDSNANSYMQILCNGNTGLLSVETRVRQMTQVVKVVNNWENLSTGTPLTIKSQFRQSGGGTATIFQNYNMIYLITEYP